ncbi:transposon Tf2-1 polyprotein isoform X1 [Cucumis melo var. makuwa]|uniref:Transposon Tf2-1 polyprotein isoform X1 n=1 Tax=Cucumis melo var. makuwa TaxID=1194695 RepID=A0A5D3BSA4_CUCMM|nr:transposon Tf2-1 polyprotein isoform X1 [Cucumis melo var. makuwa]
MSFQHGGRKVIIHGDPSLTKKGVNLRSMMKTWEGEDQGFLVECRAIEGKVPVATFYEEELETTVDNSIPPLLKKFLDVFEWPETLPPKRGIKHHIHLKHVYSKGLEEHIQHLELVLEILRANEFIAGTLTQLLNNGSFKWNEEAETSFEKLKTTMMTLPVLAMPNFNLPFEIEMDASGYGVGAVLTQAKRPIAYFSRTLSMKDKAKPRSLKFLLEERVIQPQYQKWIAKLLGYSFGVVYKPGLENKAADALSRVPPTIHLNQLSAPALIDLGKIQEEVENDPKLKEIRSIVEQDPEEFPNFTVN